MHYETSQDKTINYVSANCLLQTPKNNGMSALPLSSATAQGKKAIQKPAHTEPTQKQANHTNLPENLKTGVENRSGFSLDNVKVHYNSSKPAQFQALAYTQGTDIHVAPGQEKHLPHEAWHVVQQMQGRVKPTFQMKGVGVNDDAGMEREADVAGNEAIRLGNEVMNTTIQNQAKNGENSVLENHINMENGNTLQRQKRPRVEDEEPVVSSPPHRRRKTEEAAEEDFGGLGKGLNEQISAEKLEWLGQRGLLYTVGSNQYWGVGNGKLYNVINGVPQVPGEDIELVAAGTVDIGEGPEDEYAPVLQMHKGIGYIGNGAGVAGHTALNNQGFIGNNVPGVVHKAVVGAGANNCTDILNWPGASKLAWGAHHQPPNPPPANSVVHRVQANAFRNPAITRAFAKVGPVKAWCATYIAKTGYAGAWNMHHWLPLAWDGNDNAANLTPLPTSNAGGVAHQTHNQWHKTLLTGGGKMYPKTMGQHYKFK